MCKVVGNVVIGSTDLNGVDFGVNFDVIVNTNDSGQGSFRQFIINSNELSNSNLDQEDDPTSGVNFSKPLGIETSIFMMPTPGCLLYTSPSPRDQRGSRMPSSA